MSTPQATADRLLRLAGSPHFGGMALTVSQSTMLTNYSIKQGHPTDRDGPPARHPHPPNPTQIKNKKQIPTLRAQRQTRATPPPFPSGYAGYYEECFHWVSGKPTLCIGRCEPVALSRVLIRSASHRWAELRVCALLPKLLCGVARVARRFGLRRLSLRDPQGDGFVPTVSTSQAFVTSRQSQRSSRLTVRLASIEAVALLLGRNSRLTHSTHLPSDHSSSPPPSTVPVLMLAMSFISFSLIGIGAQASGPWVQITMPFFAPS